MEYKGRSSVVSRSRPEQGPEPEDPLPMGIQFTHSGSDAELISIDMRCGRKWTLTAIVVELIGTFTATAIYFCLDAILGFPALQEVF